MHLDGSCHCGAVGFSVEAAAPVPFLRCYCSICRKTGGGGGYAINLGAQAASLEVRGVDVPKALADRYGIEPGAELEWQAAGDVIRVIPPGRRPRTTSVETRLELFDAATERQRARQEGRPAGGPRTTDRGWRRDGLYGRDGAP